MTSMNTLYTGFTFDTNKQTYWWLFLQHKPCCGQRKTDHIVFISMCNSVIRVNPSMSFWWSFPFYLSRQSLMSVHFCRQASPVTFNSVLRDNVIMVREMLLSNLSPPCDDLMLRWHVRHHTPEHLSVFGSGLDSALLVIWDKWEEGQSQAVDKKW